MNTNDGIICFNFRPDRAREITRCFCEEKFEKINVKKVQPKEFVCMTQYDVTIPNVKIAFSPQELKIHSENIYPQKGLNSLE